jgi:CheY-like chemotaxis protein
MKAILFVDDNEMLARVSCEILQLHGYRAEWTVKVSDALTMFEREKFDMLVTDYSMDEMNGLELARLMRQKAPGLPVIIVSGYPPLEGSDEVDGWIEKQDMFPALLDKVKSFLGEGERQLVGGGKTLKRA